MLVVVAVARPVLAARDVDRTDRVSVEGARLYLEIRGADAHAPLVLWLHLDAVVRHLRGPFGDRKVTLLGHSWGAALGLLYAASHPETRRGRFRG